jgi:tetratricopeptide (TPR) repeat protein
MEAIRSFKQALKHDPECAMAHWGVAFALGPNYNAAFDTAVLKIVNNSLEAARRYMDDCTPKERDLIEALSARYPAKVDEDQTAYEEAYAQKLRRMAKKYPADDDIQALLAEALMNLHPWDLWKKDGRPQPWTPEILELLEGILERNPDHIAAIHLYIHATEASYTPELAKPWAARLPGLAPGAGHLVHMPSHTYIRTGDYHDGVIANANAVEVDSIYTSACHAAGIYPLAYYPHNFHFLAACAAFEGNSKTAIEASWRMVEKLDTVAMREPGYETIQHYYSIPYYVLVKFARWDEILDLPRPARDLLYPTAIWRYARGMAFAGKGQMAEAERELKNLQLLQKDENIRRLTVWDINTIGELLDIAAYVLEGEIAAAEGDYEKAVQLLEAAVAIEDALGYNEPPDWFFSVRHHLGPVLMEMGAYAKAEEVYRRDLELFPKTGYALNGLYQALIKQGKAEEAGDIRRRFERAWQYADVSLEGARVR